jgi:hypothetical protein
MGRSKKPVSQMTDVQLVKDSAPKPRYYHGTEGRKMGRGCLLCGAQITGTLRDLEQHQYTHLTQYDYDKQCWIVDGLYTSCNHPDSMNCNCYGRLHQGEKAPDIH